MEIAPGRLRRMRERSAFRTCPFCEATCGLEVTVRDGAVVKVRGDAQDVFSRGFLCPKGVALQDLHDDPDRLRTPMVRGDDGELRPASWDEALGLIALLYGRVFLKALGSRSVYSASTVDQRPKEIAAALMFGTGLTVPIPDV